MKTDISGYPYLYAKNPRRCSVCGGPITSGTQFFCSKDGIVRHADVTVCLKELQHTIVTTRKANAILTHRMQALKQDVDRYLCSIAKTKWGALAKAKIETYRLSLRVR